MGRPLFSICRQPAVRVEPEPQYPAVEKWTYWNAFDPDSDEFFDNAVDEFFDNAVNPAFVSPAAAERPQIRAVVDVEVSSSSDGFSSGRGSPMEVEDVGHFETERAGPRARQGGLRVIGSPESPVPDLPSRNTALDAGIDAGVDYYMSLLDRFERLDRGSRPVVRERVPTYLDLPQEGSRSPSPEPVMLTRASMPSTPARASTPPPQSTPLLVSPSPPPSVTPRLYSWTSAPPPVPTSPLTNRSARMSVAHIVPQRIPAYRIA